MAIKAVIQGETRTFFDRDYAAWAEHWVRHDAAFQAWSNQDGTFDASLGWDDVSERIRKYIEAHPEPSHPVVIRKNFKYRISGDVAYVTFDQYNSSSDGTRMTTSKESSDGKAGRGVENCCGRRPLGLRLSLHGGPGSGDEVAAVRVGWR